MVRINRSVIAKAIFSISVVAVTASAGVVGLAQAAHHSPTRAAVLAAASDGYGGIGDQIRAAVEAFQRAVKAASDQFQADVANCVQGLGGNSDDLAPFRADSTAAVSDFSAQTANPTAFSNTTKFDSHVNAANTNLEHQLDTDAVRLAATLDRHQDFRNRHNEFRQCLNNARKDYHDALNDARQALRNALRGIFH